MERLGPLYDRLVFDSKKKGYLQVDGYSVHQGRGKKKVVTHLACWAHARREFERALDNDRPRTEMALLIIQGLYVVERRSKQEGLSPRRSRN